MTKKSNINVDKWRERLLLLFASSLALGSWNPFIPVNLEIEANDGINLAQIITVVYIGALIYLQSIENKIRINYPFRSCIVWFYVFLLSTTLITSIDSIYFSNLSIFVKLGLCISLIFLIPANYSTNKTVIYKSFLFFSITSTLIAFLAISGFLGDVLINHKGRMFLLGENPNSTGGRMSLAIFFLMYLIIENPLKWGAKRFMLIIAIVPLLILMLAGGSRGAFVILSVVLLFYLMFRRSKHFMQKIFLIIILILTGGLVINNILKGNEEFTIMERMSSMVDGDDAGRSDLNNQTMVVFFKNNIVLGSGTIHYREEMQKMFSERRVAHNLYVYLIAVAGLLGSLLFYFFIFGMAKCCYIFRNRDILPSALLLFMLLLAGKTGGVLAYLLMWYVWSIVICLTCKPVNAYANNRNFSIMER